MHGGDPERSLAALSSLGSVREDLERVADPELQASLARVRRTDGRADPDATAPHARAAGTSTAAGARFRILRFHRTGGLGEVYVARDEELHREVALKEIQDRHADDPDSRSRFLLEAEITGGLEHPGIIPVYGLGTYDDGRPFYAMRFIKGDSLKEAIEHFHEADVPGATRASGRWRCASCSGGSSTSATRWPTPTAGACCTATSSRATSCSAPTARRWWSTGGWPSRSGGPRRRRRTDEATLRPDSAESGEPDAAGRHARARRPT